MWLGVQGLIVLFDQLDPQARQQQQQLQEQEQLSQQQQQMLQQVWGTVLVHVNHAIKYDHHLGQVQAPTSTLIYDHRHICDHPSA